MKITSTRGAEKTRRALTTGAICALALCGALAAAQAATTHRHHATAHHTRITTAQANAIALKKFPGTLTAKTTLENEEGSWQYGAMVRSGRTLREVMIDASSGKIVSVETTTTGKERVEARAEAKAEASAHKAHHRTVVKRR